MRFSYKGGCVVCEHMCIETFKTRAGWAIDKRVRVISNTMLFTIVISLLELRYYFKCCVRVNKIGTQFWMGTCYIHKNI